MARIRVGVLRGGVGHEYDVSLSTGSKVLQHLPKDRYEPVDMLITKDGRWHVAGLPIAPGATPMYVDVVFNALHGEYGEDGQVQKVLDALNLPYTGSGAYASSLAMNKPRAKELFKQHELKVPHSLSLEYDGKDMADYAQMVFAKISPPWIVKPADKGSSVGIFVVKFYPELARALEQCFAVSDRVLVEELIKGREATGGVIENFRGHNRYSLPVVEISKPLESPFWTYEDKYQTENVRQTCPACFAQEEKSELEELAVMVHDLLGLRHYSRTDFILSPRGIYVLETNSLPGLTPESSLPKALEAVGCSYEEFLDHLLQLALRKDY